MFTTIMVFIWHFLRVPAAGCRGHLDQSLYEHPRATWPFENDETPVLLISSDWGNIIPKKETLWEIYYIFILILGNLEPPHYDLTIEDGYSKVN